MGSGSQYADLYFRKLDRPAYAAYRGCIDAITNAIVAGLAPSQGLLNNEAKATAELNDARANLLGAIRGDC